MPGGADPTRLLYLVTEDWYVCSHRLPLIRAAVEAGLAVTVVTRVRDHGEAIRATGAQLVPLDWRRGSAGPVAALRDAARITALYRRLKPHIVHHVAIKPAVLGGIAAMLADVPAVVTTLAGRGVALSGDGPGARIGGAVLRGVLGLLESSRMARLIVQNADDLEWARRRPAVRAVELLRGSGVDLARFSPVGEPSTPFTVAQVSRMLTIKGVGTVVDAIGRLREAGIDARLLLAGDSDPESRAAIPEETLRAWSQLPGVEWLGRVRDVRAVWARAHVAVLASIGGEGVPKSLLEAAACAKPIVATDVPGNREVARPEVNAVLVPPGDARALSEALARMAGDPALRRRLGAASRAVVDPEFGDAFVTARVLEIYRELAPMVASVAS